MKSGLMWYDPDARKPASAKIEEAARRYEEKFGVRPNACHVSPEQTVTSDRVEVVANRWIRPNYYWLGVDEDLVVQAKPRARASRDGAVAVAVPPSPAKIATVATTRSAGGRPRKSAAGSLRRSA